MATSGCGSLLIEVKVWSHLHSPTAPLPHEPIYCAGGDDNKRAGMFVRDYQNDFDQNNFS